MGPFVPWIEVTVPGVVILFASCILVFRFTHRYNLDFPKGVSSYVPYLAIGAVFLAYITGLALHLAICKVISIWSDSATPSVSQLVALRDSLPKQVQDAFGSMYGNLVMFRLLVLAFLLLLISLRTWLPRTSLPKPHWPVYIGCVLFIVLFSYAYSVQRGLYTGFRDDVKIKYPELYIH